MFGSKKEKSTVASQSETPEPQLPKGYTPKKGVATPTRKEAEARNLRPVVANKTKLSKEERKRRKAEQREASNELWMRQQEAMRTGDEARMPYQHRGKARAFGRDVVDASFTFSSWFMPTAVLLFPVMFVGSRFPTVAMSLTLTFYLLFILMIINAAWVVRRAKKLAVYKFGAAEVPRGFSWQMLGRAFYLRRWRLPKVRVARGEFPQGATKEDIAHMRAEHRAMKKNRGV